MMPGIGRWLLASKGSHALDACPRHSSRDPGRLQRPYWISHLFTTVRLIPSGHSGFTYENLRRTTLCRRFIGTPARACQEPHPSPSLPLPSHVRRPFLSSTLGAAEADWLSLALIVSDRVSPTQVDLPTCPFTLVLPPSSTSRPLPVLC